MKNYKQLETKPYLLKNKIQNYLWGSKGKAAFIPKLLNMEYNQEENYAELWIGAHPKAPSHITINNKEVALNKIISENPNQILGKRVASQFKNTLPFLFKILSAGDALSIQAHPNKEQAAILHKKDPKNYPDDNHKPEIAIALDSLYALVGFKRPRDIESGLIKYPELSEFIGKEVVKNFCEQLNGAQKIQKSNLKNLYSTLMKQAINQKDKLKNSLNSLAKRLINSNIELNEEEKLFLELKKKYPNGDVGLFSIFLLNHIHLKSGEAIFLKAGIPHAYLKGNIIECMANSDNVVRAGLTPKFKDISTLIEILTYDYGPIEILNRNQSTENISYITPTPEFNIKSINLKEFDKKIESPDHKVEILLLTKGKISIQWQAGSTNKTMEVYKGQSLLIPAALPDYSINALDNSTLFKVQIP